MPYTRFLDVALFLCEVENLTNAKRCGTINQKGMIDNGLKIVRDVCGFNEAQQVVKKLNNARNALNCNFYSVSIFDYSLLY